MKILPIHNYGIHSNNKSHKTTTHPNFNASMSITGQRNALYKYIADGFKKTEAGKIEYDKIFGQNKGQIDLLNFERNDLPIEEIIKRCNGMPEVIDRALGRYGLVLYSEEIADAGEKVSFSSVIKESKDVYETGYKYPNGNMYHNFIWYLSHNPRGRISDISERFGENSPNYLDSFNSVGSARIFSGNYRILSNELTDVLARTIYSANMHQMISKYHI